MSWPEVIALIGALAALIGAVTELIRVLLPIWQRQRESGQNPPNPEQAPILPQVSRRTTWSLSLGSIAAVLAVALVGMVSFGGSASNPGLALVLLGAIGILAWPGAALGVEKAWTAWGSDRRLALNAAAGTGFGLLAWVSALVITTPYW